MSRGAFRRFEFFDVEVVAENIVSTLGYTPTCCIAESGLLIFGDDTGHITVADRDFQISERRNRVFKGEVKGIAYLHDPLKNNKHFIVAIGDDSRPRNDNMDISTSGNNLPSNAPTYVVKVFSTSDMTRPLHQLPATINDAKVTSFAVLEDATHIAVGYSNGRVVLFTGPFLKDNAQIRISPPAIIISHHAGAVNALHFCELPGGKNDERKIKLFATFHVKVQDQPVTNEEAVSNTGKAINQQDYDEIKSSGILVFDVSFVYNSTKNMYMLTNSSQEPNILDDRGAPPSRTSYMPGNGQLVVARAEAVYNYTVDDRGGALALFGEKVCVCCVGRYVLIVTFDEKNNTASITASTSNNHDNNRSRRAQVNVYDLKNKIICGTAKKYFLPANERIIFAMHDEGVAYLITTSWTLLRFREKETSRKLEVLLEQYNPPLYSLAISIAAEEQMDAAEVMKLYKLYGDYLYSKQEFDQAILQFCNTMGYLPPSYVINKFLDPYRINNLIMYLEKLREKSLAASDHITLLLTCYTKLKDEARINTLLDSIFLQTTVLEQQVLEEIKQAAMKSSSSHSMLLSEQLLSQTNKQKLKAAYSAFFDPATAVRTLQAAGLVDQGLRVATRYQQHATYLDIQLRKVPVPYDEALGYLAYAALISSSEDTLTLLQRHGTQLLDGRPKAFIQLLVLLCTGDFTSLVHSVTNPGSSSATVSAKYSSSSNTTTSNMLIWSNDFSTSLKALLNTRSTISNVQTSTLHSSTHSISALDILPLFHGQHYNATQLLAFLEGLTRQTSMAKLWPAKIWTTLLELYMQQYATCKLDIQTIKAKAGNVTETEKQLSTLDNNIMSILDGANSSYDIPHALLLTTIHSYDKGCQYLLEKQHSVELLFKRAIDSHEYRDLFKLLRKEGSKQPELFIRLLTHLVQETIDADVAEAAAKEKDKLDSDDEYDQDHDNDNNNEHGKQKKQGQKHRDRSNSDTDSDSHSGSDSDDSLSGVEGDESGEDSRWDLIMDVVDLIEKESILSPVQVLTILSANQKLPVKVVADYLDSTLRELSEGVSTVQSNMQSALTNLETIAMSSQAESELRPNVSRNRRTARGVGAYDDYDDDEEEDEESHLRQAEKEKEKWAAIRRSQLECSQDHEAFFKELELSTDGFATVANYFGRSIISFSNA